MNEIAETELCESASKKLNRAAMIGMTITATLNDARGRRSLQWPVQIGPGRRARLLVGSEYWFCSIRHTCSNEIELDLSDQHT